MKKALTMALAAVFILALAVTVFAQDMTHETKYEMDGMIDIEKQVGHLCNTGAELKQTIYGQGEMSKTMDTVQVEGKITVNDEQDWVTAEGALHNLTVTSVIELCAPPKHEYTTTHFVPIEPSDLFELTFNIIGEGSATGAGFYAAGEEVAIEAIPDPENIFQFWSAPAGALDNEFAASTTFTMPAEDVTVTARFMPEGEFEERDRNHTHLCWDQTGGVGIIIDTWDISQVGDGTSFDFYFHALSMPDRWTIWYGGNLVFSSGWVSSEPGVYEDQPLFVAEGVQHHYWHPNVEPTTWRTSWGTHPEGGLYEGIITKQAGVDEIVIRSEGGEPGTVWYYQLCTQPQP